MMSAIAEQERPQDDEESSRLLTPAAAAAPYESSHLAIFNDLTYSDDDETDEYWDNAELGAMGSGGGSMSSPETAALLDEIQNAMFLSHQQYQQLSTGTTAAVAAAHQQQGQQQQQQQQSHHLMHPLARGDSLQSDTDEGSHLQFSIASGEATDQCRISPTNYGAVERGSGPYDFRPKSPVVIFRPSSSVFDNRKQQKPSLPPQRGKVSPPKVNPKIIAGKPRPSLDRKNSPPSVAQSTTNNTHNGYPMITPLPSLSNESPVTSATATDEHSPRDASNNLQEEEEQGPEKERITKLLSAEATKRVRRHRRLKRIKKAAEAREAAVQKVRGTEQDPSKCNDAIFAFIFLCQFLLVSMSALAFGPGALRDKIYGSLMGDPAMTDDEDLVVDYNPFAGLQTDDVIIMDNPPGVGVHNGFGDKDVMLEEDIADGMSHIDYINTIQLVCIVSGYASLCSLLAWGFMMMLSKNFLHATLVFTIGVCATWTVLGFAFSPNWIIPSIGSIALALSFFYTVVVWDRISFAATNLSVALKGMRSTMDIPFVGLGVLAATFLWTNLWICAFVGTFDFLNDDADLSNDWMSVVIVFFLFSYYWTFQVIKGISQTTVASIIGKWWDMSEEDQLPLCSSVLHSTLTRNIIGSFGSICLGGLIVSPCIHLTRISMITRLAKPKLNKLKTANISPKLFRRAESEDIKCDAGGCMKNTTCSPPHTNGGNSIISRNVNQWSFTYIGLYGYEFWDSGSKAFQLFEARGWTHVVSDDLIMTVMAMSCMIIGAFTACLALIVEEVDGFSFTSLNKPITTAFFIGLLVGFFLSSAFLSIIEGSVSAILVCYATSPVKFHANHHKLSEEMKSVWKHFWLQKPAPI